MARFDIHFQALTEEEQRGTYKFVSFTFNPTVGVKGFQMLINQWLKCFLTPKGSDPTDLDYGTDFTKLLGSNLAIGDARDVSLIAVDQCNEQIFDIQRNESTFTASERLASAEITNFTENTTSTAPGFSLYVELKNQANERLVLNLPASAVMSE